MSNDSQQSRFINLVNTIASLQQEKNETEEIAAKEKKLFLTEKFEVCFIFILFSTWSSLCIFIFIYSLKNQLKN